MSKLTIEEALSDSFKGIDSYDMTQEEQDAFFARYLKAILVVDPQFQEYLDENYSEEFVKDNLSLVCGEWEHEAMAYDKLRLIEEFNKQ